MYELNGQQFTIEELNDLAAQNGLTFDELIAKNPEMKQVEVQTVEKQQPQITGASVGATAAPDMVSSLEPISLELQEQKVTPLQSIKNAISNVGKDIGRAAEFWTGESGTAELASAALFESFFGRKTAEKIRDKYGDAWVAQGIGLEEILQNIPEAKEELEKKQTLGLIESFKEGNIADFAGGAISTIINALGSVIYGVGTAGFGYYFDYAAENYIDYNEAKAKRKNTSLNQLILDNEDETLAPVAIGALQARLENIGITKILKGTNLNKALTKKLANSPIAKKALQILDVGAIEAVTETNQHLLSKFNQRLAETNNAADALGKVFTEDLFTEETYESALQGFIGGSGLRASGTTLSALPSIRTYEESKQIDTSLNKIRGLNKDKAQATDEKVKNVMEQEIEIEKAKITKAVSDANNRLFKLPKSKIDQISQISKNAFNEIKEMEVFQDKLDANEISKEEYDIAYQSTIRKFEENKLRIKGILSEEQTVEEAVQKSIDFSSKIAKLLNVDVKIINTIEEFKKFFPEDQQKNAEKVGGLYIPKNKTVLINKQAAINTLQINIGAHEILHPILNSQIGDVQKQKEIVEGFKKNLNKAQRQRMDELLASKEYTTDEKYNTEYITVFSDAIAKGELDYDTLFLEKIANFFKNLFKDANINLGWESGDQVFEFMKAFSTSSKEGELSNEIKNIIDTSKEDQLKVTKQFSIEEEYESLNERLNSGEIDTDTYYQILDTLEVKEEQSRVERRKSSRPAEVSNVALKSKTVLDDIGNNPDGYNAFDPKIEQELGKMAAAKARAFRTQNNTVINLERELQGFNMEDFKGELYLNMLPYIQKFDPSKNDSLYGYINAQLQNRINGVLKTGRVAEQTGQRSFEATTAQFAAQEEITGVEDAFLFSDEEADLSVELLEKFKEENKSNLINPIKKLDGSFEENALEEFGEKSKDADLNDLILKTTPNLVSKSLSEYFGVEESKINNPKANLNTGEVNSTAKKLFELAQTFIDLLPSGAILEGEAATEKLIGTGTGVPRSILNAFYTKEDRLTKGAGLSPWVKRTDIVLEDFYNAIGVDADGNNIKGITGRTPEAQTRRAMIDFYGVLTTNTLARIEMENSGIDPRIIQDAKAGTSELQFSVEETYDALTIDELASIFADTNSLYKKIQKIIELPEIKEQLKANFGIELTQEDLERFRVSRRTQDGHIFNYEKLIQLNEQIDFYVKNMPDAFKNQKTLYKNIAGIVYRTNLYGYKKQLLVNNTGTKKLVDSNGNIITDIKKINKVIKPAEHYNTLVGKGRSVNFSEATKSLNKTLNGEIKRLPRKTIPLLANVKKQISKAVSIKEKQKIIDEFKETNVTRENAFNLLNNYKYDYLTQEGLTVEERKTRLLFLIQLALFDGQSMGGIKSLSTLSKNSNILSEGEQKYRLEHLDATSNTSLDVLLGLIGNSAPTVNNRAAMWPSYISKRADSKAEGLLTAMFEEKENFKNKMIEENEGLFQYSFEEDYGRMNDMISETGKVTKEEISEVTATKLGRTKGRFRFFIPPSADDFMGLMYYMLRKGRVGDEDLKFIQEKLIKPFTKGQAAFDSYKLRTLAQFREFKKLIRKIPKAKLSAKNDLGFTNEEAVRVYIWNKQGIEIPGISKSEVEALVKLVEGNSDLLGFAGNVSNLLNAQGGYPAPQENWFGGSITIDVLEHINEISRKEFFAEFNEAAEAFFGKLNNRGEIQGPIANKLRAAYGDNYIEALSDILYRMKNGRGREFGKNKLVNQFNNWISNSVGAVMFLNARSALLQQVSLVNFINLTDNNPIKFAAAIANPKQYWADYLALLNSDYLVQRRSGIKIDVNQDELVKAAESGRNPVQSVISLILKKGFVLTTWGDSHAIATGGAAFYRNRINTYLNDGLSQAEAEAKAFDDFKELAEESQQSSRPDRISKQQASTLGRLILAWANTPMQYARITKKAALDLINGRGDWKTNTSKLIYYGAIQNIMFTYLQQGLFAMIFDGEDDEEEDMNKYGFAFNSMADGFLRGLGFGGAVVATSKNMVLEAIDQAKGRGNYDEVVWEALKLSPPLGSKISKARAVGRTFGWKQEREKVFTEGFSLDNPAFEAVGKAVSATTNIPLDRVVRKLDNITYPVRHETEFWQTIALYLGWGQWELGLKDVKKREKEKQKPKAMSTQELIEYMKQNK